MAIRASKPAFNIREKLKELTHSIGLKGRELMRAATVQDARDLVSAGRRNLIINGNMSVWQRGTAQTTVATGVGYLADRWQVATGGSAQLTHEQSTDSPPGFPYSLKISPSVTDTLVSTEQMHVTQLIEAQNMTFLNWGSNDGIPITVSFWAKSSDTSNKCLWLYAQDAGDHIARQFNCSKANTWEKFTFTIPPNPGGVIANNNGTGLYVRIVLDAGASAADGNLPETWTNLTTSDRYGNLEPGFAESTSNEFYLTGVQVEAGKNATDFEHRSYGEELALCQRYYIRYNASDPYTRWGLGIAQNTTALNVIIHHPVTMRGVPTVIEDSGIGTIQASNTYLGYSSTASATLTGNTDNLNAALVSVAVNSGLTQGNTYFFEAANNSNAYIAFGCEL